MVRPVKPLDERKIRINISLDKRVYNNLRPKVKNVSGLIENLVKMWLGFNQNSESLRRELNPRPPDYKSGAQPLSY